MSYPSEEFYNLSLHSPMQSPNPIEAFRRRKAEIQDILSSFSRDDLPSEFRSPLFQSISEAQRDRPGEWTIAGDLEGTLAQWGVHDVEVLRLLTRVQPEDTRSRLFHEKVARLLEMILEAYQNIDRSQSANEIRNEVQRVADRIRSIIEESKERQRMESRAVQPGVFVRVLRDVCENNLDISGGGSGVRTRRSSGSQTEVSLYHTLVADPPTDEHFLLKLLDWVAETHRGLLIPHKGALERIDIKLETLRAPASYRSELRHIIRKLEESSEGGEGAEGGPPPPPPPAAPKGKQSGTKRPAGGQPGKKEGKRRAGA